MKDKEIKDILKNYEQSYTPWECDDGNCIPYTEGHMVDFGKEMYERGREISKSTTLKDRDGVIALEGDVRDYNGKSYNLLNRGFQWVLDRSLREHGENDTIVVDEDVIWESQLVTRKE